MTEPYGPVMSNTWTCRQLLKKTAELKKYFDSSFAYTSSLRPKPGKKKATKKS